MPTPSKISISNPSEGDSFASPVFPTEIFSEIIHHVAVSRRPRYRNPDDPAAFDARWQAQHPFFRLQNLRLVSRTFDKLAADYLFYRLIVSGYTSHQSDLWRALADGSTRLGSSVRRINIALGSFSSAHSQRKLRESMQQEIELLELVARAIPNLPLLAEAIVNLQVRFPEPEEVYTYRYTYQKPIVTAQHLACINRMLVGLATLPRVPLKVLQISGSVSGIPLVVGFTELRRLTIRNPLDADVVSALIADNPHLDILTISAHFFLSVGDVLPSLLPDADRRLKALSLEHLTFLPGDVPLLIPFINQVKSLAFFCMNIPDNLWITGLSTPSCFLRRLSIVDCPMPLTESFVDFISSCSVLEYLRVTLYQLEYQQSGTAVDTSSTTVRRFWIDVLPRLAGSLRGLHLFGPEVSGLCIQFKYIDALSQCHLLENLIVGVNTDLANAAQMRTVMHRILTTLCRNSWPVMDTLCMYKCPNVRANESPIAGHYGAHEWGTHNLLLHNTEFETSTGQIFQTRISIFDEAHVFKRVDGVVRFLATRFEPQGGQADHNVVAVDGDQSDDDANDGMGLPWYFEPGIEFEDDFEFGFEDSYYDYE